jgi:AcrR family transcriptional regulator
MVDVAGTHGYDATTIEAVCARAETPRAEFDRFYSDKEDCFLRAYDQVAVAFGEAVISAYHAHTAWHDRVWASGWAAMTFFREDPRRAHFFMVEANNTGARVQTRRDRVRQVFVDLIDAGRAELDDPASISRATAEMVAGAIYFTFQNKILEGCLERGEDFLVELVYIAVFPYLGAKAAEAELQVQPLREVP